MSLKGVVELLAGDESLARCVHAAVSGRSTFDVVVPTAGRAPAVAALAEASGRPILLVTPTVRAAEVLISDLESLLGEQDVAYYPSWETLPHERFSPRSDTVGRRLETLRRIAGRGDAPAPRIVVTPVRSMLQPQAAGLVDLAPVRVRVGQDYDITALARDLSAAAYSRVDLVERRGEFAVRGGIVDVFAPTYEHPVRIDFFGDEVEEIRLFSVADQLSLPDQLDEFVADPCREVRLTEEVCARAAKLVDSHPELSDMLERISQGQAVEGMEALIPVLVDRLELLVDVVPEDTLVLASDPELIHTRAADLFRTSQEFMAAGWVAAAAGGKAPIDLGASAYWEFADVRLHALARGLSWWGVSVFDSAAGLNDEASDGVTSRRMPALSSELGGPEERKTSKHGSLTNEPSLDRYLESAEETHVNLTQMPSFTGNADGAVEAMRDDVRAGRTVIAAVGGKGLAKRLSELLSAADVPVRGLDSLDEADDILRADTPKPRGQVTPVTVVPVGISVGFRAPGLNLHLYSTAEITGAQGTATGQAARKLPSKRRNQVVPLELKFGDALVHEQHGVGRYIEMTRREVAGASREYLVIEYAPSKRGQPGDRLYVPMDQLDQITRYVGGEVPQLDRMGGADWKARKSRAKRAVREIAGELIKLYAARQATKGHAFGPDTPWQREMEDAFAFTETPDQLTAINDVKADMEQIVPMDRLVCGDVGYGKTEIAVRAAFKAVQDGKQVAILVPTTLLVQQHHATFAARYAAFPIRVASLSRFQTPAEVKAALEGISDGSVDVAIGTHKLLGSGVKFKDLGLVIIDEEQRFGVEHKETLKKLRVNVDVLSMSATPIPRTLEMAVTGIREMSTIATPPEERHPVLTFVGGYDEGQIVAAIRRELAREGQVFFVHNRVSQINKIATRLGQLVPEARIATAHGQMNEHLLEQVMVDFFERRADVLVCTTIVEAGLDIASANTLIVDNADKLGLSQLHQLRGRVGRSRERGYAYFLYPPLAEMNQTAHERLSALASNNELGSGIAIAMKDLEIRGAGNLLGAEQSGHIADVGFDLYLRLVGEAVAAYRGGVSGDGDGDGDDGPDATVMRIDLPVDANLGEEYIESERLRLEMYRRIAEIRDADETTALVNELIDRYGPLPDAAARLFDVVRFRLLCAQAGLREVVSQGQYVRFGPVTKAPGTGPKGAVVLRESQLMRLNRLYPGSIVKTDLMLVKRPTSSINLTRTTANFDILSWAETVVHALFFDL
ncbi:MAG: transcription-repair coupling factor [Propionibacteriaceae bacterium]|nr:transcription-repair coupling factor [Propionibacteriaceae bacterium]